MRDSRSKYHKCMDGNLHFFEFLAKFHNKILDKLSTHRFTIAYPIFWIFQQTPYPTFFHIYIIFPPPLPSIHLNCLPLLLLDMDILVLSQICTSPPFPSLHSIHFYETHPIPIPFFKTRHHPLPLMLLLNSLPPSPSCKVGK